MHRAIPESVESTNHRREHLSREIGRMWPFAALTADVTRHVGATYPVRGMGRGMEKGMGQGMSQGMGQGLEEAVVRTMPRDMKRGYGAGYGTSTACRTSL